MAATQTAHNAQRADRQRNESSDSRLQSVDVKEDVIDYLTSYARQKPAHAALICLGVGFVLGWKLKPW